MTHERQVFFLLYLPQGEVFGYDIGREKVCELVVADVELASEFANLDINVLPLNLGHRCIPADKLAIIDRRKSKPFVSVSELIELDDVDKALLAKIRPALTAGATK